MAAAPGKGVVASGQERLESSRAGLLGLGCGPRGAAAERAFVARPGEGGRQEEGPPPPPPAPLTMATVGVLGSTGAVGREVVREASHAPEVGRVVAFLRRDAAPEALFPGADVAKVEARVVEFGRLRASDFAGLDAVACCLGTTKADAGSAAARHVVDCDYVLEAARLAKEGGTAWFGLVTSAGVSPTAALFSSYLRTKLQAEEGVKGLGFARTAIWRPGLLHRGERARAGERVGLAVAGGMPVATVARAMVRNFQDWQRAGGQGAAGGVAVFGDREIYGLAGAAGGGTCTVQ